MFTLQSICSKIENTFGKEMSVEELKDHVRFLYTNPEEEVQALGEPYDGTFSKILDMVKAGQIVIATNSADYITGFEVLTNSGDLHIDQLYAEAFRRAYGCKPVMNYVILAYMIHINKLIVNNIQNDGTSALLVEVEDPIEHKVYNLNIYGDEWIEKPHSPSHKETEQLPEKVVVPSDVMVKGKGSVEKIVKDYLRDTYNHYLAKGNELVIFPIDTGYLGDDGLPKLDIEVSNIKWGRKI